MRYQDIVNRAVSEFRDWLNDQEGEFEINDEIYYIAESNIPVMTVTLLEVAIDEPSLAVVEPDIEFSEHTAFNAIYGVIFDEISQRCWAEYEEYVTERQEVN